MGGPRRKPDSEEGQALRPHLQTPCPGAAFPPGASSSTLQLPSYFLFSILLKMVAPQLGQKRPRNQDPWAHFLGDQGILLEPQGGAA